MHTYLHTHTPLKTIDTCFEDTLNMEIVARSLYDFSNIISVLNNPGKLEMDFFKNNNKIKYKKENKKIVENARK